LERCSPQYRLQRDQVSRLEFEVDRLRHEFRVDRRRLEAAERALADARHDLDDTVARAIAPDPAVREATYALNSAQGRLDEMRRCFERDLPRRPELTAACAAIEREDRALACSRDELAQADRRACAIREAIDKHTRCLADSSARAQA